MKERCDIWFKENVPDKRKKSKICLQLKFLLWDPMKEEITYLILQQAKVKSMFSSTVMDVKDSVPPVGVTVVPPASILY